MRYEPYTAGHILAQLQLLLFALLAFALLMRNGFFPEETRTINLDTDWSYRKFAPAVINVTAAVIRTIWDEMMRGLNYTLGAGQQALISLFGPTGRFTQVQPTGSMVLWLAILLGAALAVNLIDIT